MEQNHFIVCGLGRFGLSIVQLLNKAGKSVVVITTDECPHDRCIQAEKRARYLRVVLRCFNYDLANRIQQISSDYILLSEAKIAAPVFTSMAIQNGHTAKNLNS